MKAEKELRDYLAIPKVSFDECPLMWWKIHESLFPLLKVLAKRFYAIPGISVPFENIFSIVGSVITKERSSLLPDNAEMQNFQAKNLEFM